MSRFITKPLDYPTPEPLRSIRQICFNRYVFENFFKPKLEYCKANDLFIELTKNDLGFIENFIIKKPKQKLLSGRVLMININQKEKWNQCV